MHERLIRTHRRYWIGHQSDSQGRRLAGGMITSGFVAFVDTQKPVLNDARDRSSCDVSVR
jgi:hypothetical protein